MSEPMTKEREAELRWKVTNFGGYQFTVNDVAELLDELDRVRAERDKARSRANSFDVASEILSNDLTECMSERDDAIARAERAEAALREATEWRTMDTLPDRAVLGAIWVENTRLKMAYWEFRVIMRDDETGLMDDNFECGWELADFHGWKPIAAPKSLVSPHPAAKP